MKRFVQWSKILAISAIPLFLGACFSVQIERGVQDPSRRFDQATREIERIEQSHPDRRGRATKLCLLVHDGSSDELVSLKVPLWIVQAALDAGLEVDEHHLHSRYSERYELDWKALKRLDRLGPGLLVSVDDDHDKILIWLR